MDTVGPDDENEMRIEGTGRRGDRLWFCPTSSSVFLFFPTFLCFQSRKLCSRPSERSDYEIRGSHTAPCRLRLCPDCPAYLHLSLSSENLSKDLYLMSQMDSDQFVPIWTIASMEGIKVLTTDMDLILDVLRCKELGC